VESCRKFPWPQTEKICSKQEVAQNIGTKPCSVDLIAMLTIMIWIYINSITHLYVFNNGNTRTGREGHLPRRDAITSLQTTTKRVLSKAWPVTGRRHKHYITCYICICVMVEPYDSAGQGLPRADSADCRAIHIYIYIQIYILSDGKVHDSCNPSDTT